MPSCAAAPRAARRRRRGTRSSARRSARCGALEAVEQALGGEVDAASSELIATARRTRRQASGRRAQNHMRHDRARHRPRPGKHRLRRRARAAAGGCVALDGGVIETRAGLAAGAAAGRDPRAPSRRCSRSTSPTRWRSRSCTSARTCARAFAVGQARGVVMLAAGQRGVPCASYTPQQVKGAVCGNGRADKEQVARMVQALLGLTEEPRPDHAADALAVAICHANCAPLRARPRGGRRDDRAAARRGRGAPRRPRRGALRQRRLPRGRLGGDAPPRPRGRARRSTLHTHLIVARRRARALRLPLRAGARSVPDAALRAGGRPEGRAGGALRRHRRASCMAALAAGDAARFQACPGSASAPPSGSSSSCARRSAPDAGAGRRRRSSPAAGEPATRARWPATGCSSSATRPARPRSCCASAEGESAEELIAQALRPGAERS